MSDDNDWGQPPRHAPTQDQFGAPPAQPMTHQPSQTPAKVKHQLEQSDIIALIAGFFLPGLGQLLAGQTVKGIAIMAAMFFTCGIGYVASLLIIADTYFVLMCKKDREVGDWEFFPDYNRYI